MLKTTKEYNEVRRKLPSTPTPHLEPIKFIGFLQLYWDDVFKLVPGFEILFKNLTSNFLDSENGQIWVKRHVLHHQKPSQERKYMKEVFIFFSKLFVISFLQILTTLPRYPIPSDILTKPHVVHVQISKLPTDGVGLQLLELNDDFQFVMSELRFLEYF